jgi:hypothetical protein
MFKEDNMYLKPFKYKTSDGSQYLVEVDVTYHPCLQFNTHTTSSRDGLQDDITVEDVLILDEHGNDVTEFVEVPDSVIIREVELNIVSNNEGWGFEGLTLKHISDNSDYYQEEMYNISNT